VEVFLARDLLDDRVASIEEGVSRAIPIHGERINPQIFRLPNLSVNYRGIVAGVIDPNVIGIAEPGLEGGNDLRAFFIVCQLLQGPIARTMIA
jgi:hypothetical protein